MFKPVTNRICKFSVCLVGSGFAGRNLGEQWERVTLTLAMIPEIGTRVFRLYSNKVSCICNISLERTKERSNE